MAARVLLSSRIAGLYGQAAVSCGRRTYSAAAAALARKEPVVEAAAGKARMSAADKAAAKPKGEEAGCFWTRDPKTGCWMPENHLNDVVADAADLRARLLFSKKD